MTNRQYMIGLLNGMEFIDDGGASYEAMLYYNIKCPYYGNDERAYCRTGEYSRATCVGCIEEWLDSEVDE